MRGKEQLKARILEILTDSKPKILTLEDVKSALHIKGSNEEQSFHQAVLELFNEGKIKMHIAVP